MNKIEIWYCPSIDMDENFKLEFYLTKEEIGLVDEDFGIGMIETYEGSNIHLQAIKQKSER